LAGISAGEGGGVEADSREELVGAVDAISEGDALGFED
jgi:hypothetical protein